MFTTVASYNSQLVITNDNPVSAEPFHRIVQTNVRHDKIDLQHSGRYSEGGL